MSETAVADRASYTVKLEIFEGPLDLLLHLIRREEMDIYDIPIALITRQYFEHVTTMTDLDLDRASEFLLMAATLMDIKSRMLLPRPPVSEFIDEEARIDPRQELVTRLLEYKRYKEAAGHLAQRAVAARRVHSRFGGPGGGQPPVLAPGCPAPSSLEEMFPPDDGPGEGPSPGPGGVPGAKPGEKPVGVTLSALVTSLQAVLREFDRRAPFEVVRETYTVADRIAEIVPLLLEAGSEGLDFTGLLRRASTPRGVVVNFLAFLELLRRGRVRFSQERPFGVIRVWALPGLAVTGGLLQGGSPVEEEVPGVH